MTDGMGEKPMPRRFDAPTRLHGLQEAYEELGTFRL